MIRKIDYVGPDYSVIHVEIQAHDEYKIPDQVVRKALMIAINYLIENIETDKEEAPE